METIHISATVRDVFGKKLTELRKNGSLPAVVYGNKKDNIAISVNAKEFNKAFSVAGYSTIMKLKVGEEGSENVLVHDIATDPLTSEVSHVDLYRINMSKIIRTEVPLHFIGEAPAVFQQEGTLFKNIEEIELETLPATLPSHIEVDIAILDDFTKSIHVSDLKVDEGVTILTELDQLICKVEPPRSEEEIAALDEEIGDTIPEGAEEEAVEGDETEGEAGEPKEGESKEGESKEGAAKPAGEQKAKE